MLTKWIKKFQHKTEFVEKLENLAHEWIKEMCITREPKFDQWLYLIMYNGKLIPVPIGCSNAQKIIIYDNKETANKYQTKYNQNFVFVPVASLFLVPVNTIAGEMFVLLILDDVHEKENKYNYILSFVAGIIRK